MKLRFKITCLLGVIALMIVALSPYIWRDPFDLSTRWISINYALPSSLDPEMYQWLTTNRILDVENGLKRSTCKAFSVQNGKSDEITWLSSALDLCFSTNQFAVTAFPPWLIANTSGSDYSRSVVLVANSDTKALSKFPNIAIDRPLFQFKNDANWLVEVRSLKSRDYAFVDLDHGHLQMTKVKLPVGDWLGFGRDGMFLSLQPHYLSSASAAQQQIINIGRYDLRKGTNAESINSMIFPSSAFVVGYLSPKGNKILWYLQDEERKRIQFSYEWPFIGKERFVFSEMWLSDDMGKNLHEIGRFNHKENVIPKWLPDNSHVSLIVSNEVCIVTVD